MDGTPKVPHANGPRAAEAWTRNPLPEGGMDGTRVAFVRGVSRCPAEAWTRNPLPEGGMDGTYGDNLWTPLTAIICGHLGRQ